MARVCLCFVAVLWVSSLPPVALAQPAPSGGTETMAQSQAQETQMSDDRARAHFRLGREFYELGRFAQAAAEFQAAFELSGRAELLYNIYLAHRDAQNLGAAETALREFLLRNPDAPGHAQLSARLSALSEENAARNARAESEAAALAAAADAERRLLENQEAMNDANRSRPIWPWFLVGGGVLLVGGGLALGAVSSSDASALRAECPVGNQCAPSVGLEARRGDIQARLLVADVLWVGGALLTASGLVLAFTLDDERSSPVTVSPAISGSGAAFEMRGSF